LELVLERPETQALAVEKATKDAKKKSIKLAFTKGSSHSSHDVQAKFHIGAIVKLIPAPGRGLIARNPPLRTIIELAWS